MNGLLNVLKPPGMTSHDVVHCLRKWSGIKKIGHTGTLDPAAAGVLLLCFGRATKIIAYLPDHKQYRVEIAFGKKTKTGDAFGEMVYEQDAGQLTPEQLKRLFPHFTGEIQQIPPMTSAVRHQGTKLYQLARKGIEVERMPRQVTIHNLELVSWKKEQDQPVALLDVSCSAGTYIRTLCTDMGDALGCGAYMRFLLRTKAGSFGIQDAYTLEEILAKSREDILAGMLMPIERVLAHFPMVMVKESAIRSVVSGAMLHLPGVHHCPKALAKGQRVQLVSLKGILAVALVQEQENGLCFKPEKVLAGGDSALA